MKSKRILIFIWDLGIGGIQKRIKDIILSKRNDKNINFYLLVKDNKKQGFYKEINESSNVKIIFYERKYFFKKIDSLIWIVKNLNEIRPDTVLTFLDSFSVYMLAIKMFFGYKFKLILNEGILTSYYLKNFRKKSERLWKTLVKIFYPKADLIIVPSNACKNDLVKNLNINEKIIKVIPNWTLFKIDNKNRYKKEFDLIYVGRLEKEKAVEDLIFIVENLLKKYPNIRLVIIGNGYEENNLKNLVNRLGLNKNIIFTGFISNVSEYLQKSKIFVIPSKNEGIPNVVLEAYECGLPVVSNNFLGVEEVVLNNITGFVVKDRKQMNKKVLELIKNKKLIKDMGREGKLFKDKKFGVKNQDEFIGELLKP